jgi:oxygen-independent coproporphyrinogen-3 oxidase
MAVLQKKSFNPEPNPATGEEPAGIYVHIPFCQTKCPYCSFVSYPDADATFKARYMEALLQQAKEMAEHPWSKGRTFDSLFIGGGTPTAVDTEMLAAFIEECLTEYRFTDAHGKLPEVTIETNPNMISKSMLAGLRRAGVNRLSLGVQSFSDTMLDCLGRSHSSADAVNAVGCARAEGFQNINLDMMYGLPGQTIEDWQKTLDKAMELSPEHLSVYELTIEEETPFAGLATQGKLQLPAEEEVLSMFWLAREKLNHNEYLHYEISNYGRSGFQCVHNVNYWQNGSYLGLGAGAVACFSGIRLKSTDKPEQFTRLINKQLLPFREGEALSLDARFRETVIMGLRMTAGVSCVQLAKRFGIVPQEYYGRILTDLVEQRLLAEDSDWLRLTEKGLSLANQVFMQLV